jgi:hypothetical protein
MWNGYVKILNTFFSFSKAHANMGVNIVETALFEHALEVVKKPVLQVIDKRYLRNIKRNIISKYI